MSAEHQQCKRGAGLLPCVSRDSRNNEKVCWDFKANGQSFPVVIADTGLHDQATSTHTLSHTFLPAKPRPMNATSFDGIVEQRRKRNKSLDVEQI